MLKQLKATNMKIIYNSKIAKIIIPGFKMILIMSLLLCKKGPECYKKEEIKHEECRAFQWKSLCLPGFFLWLFLGTTINNLWLLLLTPFTFYIYYGIEWLIRFIGKIIKTPPVIKFGLKKWLKGFGELSHEAYREIAFEQEAYAVEKGFIEYNFLSFFLHY